MNCVFIVGNLGDDPKSRVVEPSGAIHTRFSVATTRRVPLQSGETREDTEWHTVECWGPLAKSCRDCLRKGRQVMVRGRLETQTWEDKQGPRLATGEFVRKQRTIIVADDVTFGAGERVARQDGGR